MAGYRDALPGSPGERYLLERHIPLSIAQAAGVGYAAPRAWAHRDEAGAPVRDWHRGRLVFPHTDPAGNVVNLYGRAVGDAPKGARHDHLSGAKGYFNAQALRLGDGPVTVCEGAFDALALMAAGMGRVVAIFGVSGWRWEWARDADKLLFALDGDPAGQQMFRELAPVARLRGKAVAYLELEAYGGEKDAAAAWAAGMLDVGEWPATPSPAPMLRNADIHEPAGAGGDLRKPETYVPAEVATLEPAALEGDADDPWADDDPRPGDEIATPLPAYGLTCPEARALTDSAYAVDWADELAALTPEELDAYAERMAGCGPIGQAAILEARYRVGTEHRPKKGSGSGLTVTSPLPPARPPRRRPSAAG